MTRAILTAASSPSSLGTSVAMSADGNTAVAGDPTNNAAEVFTKTSSGWSAGTPLANPGTGGFGTSVAISADGSTILVGAPGDSEAYLFHGTTPVTPALASSTPGDQFGTSVALSSDGTTALVGAPGTSTGLAYVFHGTTQFGSPLTSGNTNDQFGTSVALSSDGTTALVGAPGTSNAYIFDGASATLTSPNTNDQFGTSVALSSDGTTALVGAPANPGNAYTFTDTGGTWSAPNPLLTTPANDHFGSSVALSAGATTALVGAPADTSGDGNAYSFTQSNGTWSAGTPLVAHPVVDGFGTSVALAGDGASGVAGAPLSGGTDGVANALGAPVAAVVTEVKDSSTGQTWSGTETSGAFALDSATVDGQSGNPTGTLTYDLYDNSGCSGAAAITDAEPLESPSKPVGPLSAGSYGFEAVYSGDTTYLPSTGACEPFTVARAAITTLSASSTPNSVSYGNTVILSAAGLPSDAGGTIAFTASGQTLCTAAVSAGAGSCTTPVLPTGTYAVTAAYSGDGNYTGSSATTSFQIVPAPKTTGTTTTPFSFTSPPSVTVTRPVNQARYTWGENVRASYRCVDGANAPGLSSCQGTVPRGARIDTSTVGPHGFTVMGVSRSGESTVRTIHYVVYLASNRIAVAQPRLGADGRGTVSVRLPDRGRLTAVETAWPAGHREPPVGHQPVLSRGAVTARRAGKVSVTISPTAAGRGLLGRSHGQHLRVRLFVTFTPTGGRPRLVSKYGLLSIR